MVIALRRCLFSLLLPADPRFLSLGEARGGTGHGTNSGTAWRADGGAGCWSWPCAWAPIEVSSGLAGRTLSPETASGPQNYPKFSLGHVCLLLKDQEGLNSKYFLAPCWGYARQLRHSPAGSALTCPCRIAHSCP